jgi:hypothetical protein|tara:strand:- start:162 stop:827 length:666 start_codon:yes stop_codon:yes gene_type:complete
MTAWSYSSINTFKQCPKKYYHLKVAKDVKDVSSSAMYYGNEVHRAAEHYVKKGTPIPTKFKFIKKTLDSLNNIQGEKHCEIRMALAKEDGEYVPTTFFADNVWWRGIADLLIVDDDKAYLVDYKTGKSAKYADTKQLDLLAGATFTHYPGIKSIKSALAYVVSNEFVQKKHTSDMRKSYLTVFDDELERLDSAEENEVWNAIDGPLCAYCPVTKCEHNRRR